ncbi:MAG: hypothetical protein M0P04_08965 [Syntrophales bacterium]|nr:hypothetical protein [Syntrophales bacterium]
MFIHAVSQFVAPPAANPRTLKEVLKGYTDTPFRRVNKFILLALVGAHRCVRGRTLNGNASVYLTTENGNLGDTNNVLDQLYRQHSLPMPFSFINTMSNTAPFYVAQSLNVLGRNLSISGLGLSFERGLELARLDFDPGSVEEALIGAVDEAPPEGGAVHLAVEGSFWIHVKKARDGALGEVAEVRSFPDREALAAWCEEEPVLPPGRGLLACGAAVPHEERTDWQRRTGLAVFDYGADYGPFDTVTAYGITKFLETSPSTSLLHINRNGQGRYVALILHRYGS